MLDWYLLKITELISLSYYSYHAKGYIYLFNMIKKY